MLSIDLLLKAKCNVRLGYERLDNFLSCCEICSRSYGSSVEAFVVESVARRSH